MRRRARLCLDIGLFLGFGFAFAPAVTGISVHEWLSLAIIVPSLAHVVINWDWVMRVTAGLLGRIRTASKVNLVVDVLLFSATVTVMLSGLMVSRTIAAAIGVTSAAGTIWNAAHSLSATGTIVLLVAHFGLHASWIGRTLRGLVPAVAEFEEAAA